MTSICTQQCKLFQYFNTHFLQCFWLLQFLRTIKDSYLVNGFSLPRDTKAKGTHQLTILLCRFRCSPVPLQVSLSSTVARSSSPACLSSTFFFPPLNRRGTYKLACQLKLTWAKWAEKGENKWWYVELNDSRHFIKAPKSTSYVP